MADEIIIKTTFLLKRGTAADWARVNPILMCGEPGIETDTMVFRIGDGINHWNTLPGVKVNAATSLLDENGVAHSFEEIASIASLEVRSVSELPAASEETMNAIYLVPNSGSSPNVKDEYITIKSTDPVSGEDVYSWELIGTTEVDLSGYARLESPTFTGVVAVTGDETISGALTVAGNIQAANLSGGTTGQILTKNSNTNFDFGWSSIQNYKIIDIGSIQSENYTTVDYTFTQAETDQIFSDEITILKLTVSGRIFYFIKLYNGAPNSGSIERINFIHIETSTGTARTIEQFSYASIIVPLIYESGEVVGLSNPNFYPRKGLAVSSIGGGNHTMIQMTGSQLGAATAGSDYVAPNGVGAVPTSSGTQGQILTKGSGTTYAWADVPHEIKYVELSDGQGTLTQEQHDTLFGVDTFGCIIYTEGTTQTILEKTEVRGSVFYWTATEIVGNQILTKEVSVDYTTDAWIYSAKELEEKIDLIQIDTSTLPTTLDQTIYNTLFSSKLNKIVDIAEDDHHIRNRVYSYVDDIFDDVAEKTYTRFGCTYSDGNDIIRSIIAIDRSNRSCAAPVDYLLNQSYTAGTGIDITNNVISFDGLEEIPFKTQFTAAELDKLINYKAYITYTNGSPINFLFSGTFGNNPTTYQFKGTLFQYKGIFEHAFSINGSTLKATTPTSKIVPQVKDSGTNVLTKFYDNFEIGSAVAGTDYIAPGDSRLVTGTTTTSHVTNAGTSGSASSLTLNVDNNGVLSFTYVPNTPTTLPTFEDVTVATATTNS